MPHPCSRKSFNFIKSECFILVFTVLNNLTPPSLVVVMRITPFLKSKTFFFLPFFLTSPKQHLNKWFYLALSLVQKQSRIKIMQPWKFWSKYQMHYQKVNTDENMSYVLLSCSPTFSLPLSNSTAITVDPPLSGQTKPWLAHHTQDRQTDRQQTDRIIPLIRKWTQKREKWAEPSLPASFSHTHHAACT